MFLIYVLKVDQNTWPKLLQQHWVGFLSKKKLSQALILPISHTYSLLRQPNSIAYAKMRNHSIEKWTVIAVKINKITGIMFVQKWEHTVIQSYKSKGFDKGREQQQLAKLGAFTQENFRAEYLTI